MKRKGMVIIMFNKERLLAISELDGAAIEQMDEAQLDTLLAAANTLIDNYPLLEENVKNALTSGDHDELAKKLQEICEMLVQVCAGELAKACSEQLKTITDSPYKDFELVVFDFLKTVHAAASNVVDNYPLLEENARNALTSRNFDELTVQLAEICDMLSQINAEEMGRECISQLETVKNSDAPFKDLENYVVEFLKTVSALSIDLQLVVYQDGEGPGSLSEIGSAVAGKNTILAVDDRHFFLSSIKTMLQNTGYKATCINSGAAALNFLKNNRPGLFILDIEMPEMDGYELADRIREAGHTSPIIFLTGNSKKENVVKALKAGAADFLVKPVTKSHLLERIGKYIQPDLSETYDDDDDLEDDIPISE